MPRDFGPPPPKMSDGLKKPTKIREIPSYLAKWIKGFTTRLFYIISLVWETAPAVLIFLAVFCILDGLLPVIGAYISRELLNGIADLIGASAVGETFEDVFNTLRPILFLLLLQFIYMFFRRILERINSSVTSMAGELVVNHIKLKIMHKAKTLDMCSFDNPEFYEKLENANREAGMRPKIGRAHV